MSTAQIVGIRISCVILGWVVGIMLFGPDAVWLWGIKSYLWCGSAGGCIGILLTTQK